MGEVIYDSSSLQAYGAVLAVVLILVLVGLWGVMNGIRRRHEKMFVRVARGCAGVFFWLLALVFLAFIYYATTTGSKTMTVQVNDKEISSNNCVSGDTCYVLNAQTNSRFVDLVVSEEAYNQAQIDACYVISYFATDKFLVRTGDTSSSTIDTVTRIETAACP